MIIFIRFSSMNLRQPDCHHYSVFGVCFGIVDCLRHCVCDWYFSVASRHIGSDYLVPYFSGQCHPNSDSQFCVLVGIEQTQRKRKSSNGHGIWGKQCNAWCNNHSRPIFEVWFLLLKSWAPSLRICSKVDFAFAHTFTTQKPKIYYVSKGGVVRL